MKRLTCCSLALIALCTTLWAQNNAVPLVNQPLSPVSAAPGGSGFTLNVTGTGFASGAVLKWNGSARTTTVLSSSSLQATITSTDIAHVGTASVTVVNPVPGGGASNIVYFPIRHSAASVAFAPEPGVSPLAGPVAVGDFNHDGILDLAVGQTSSDGLSGSILFYRGLGDGTFAAPVTTLSSLPVQSLLAADFNGDGKLDVLIGTKDGDFGPAEGIVFLGNGAGHFQEQTPFGGGDFGGPIGIADLNGDGILDVLFEGEVQGSGTVQVFLGHGDGTFTQKTALNLNTTGSTAAIGDFNGDGKLDLAVPESGQVDIFLGNGDGTYQPMVPYSCYPCGGSVAAADLNGDGKLDLVVGELSVFLGNGDGTFTLGTSYGNGEGGIALGDFNGDGKLDVVTAGNTVLVYLGNGDGTFQNVISTGGFSAIASLTPFGDFNRDGQLDVVTWGSTSTQIGLQTSLSVSPSQLSFPSQRVGTNSPPQSVTLADIGTHGIPISSITIGGADPSDFGELNNCGAGLQLGKSCQLKVIFTPTTKGKRTASIIVTYSGLDTPQIITLSGVGL
jgi:FG-GAP-like repeat